MNSLRVLVAHNKYRQRGGEDVVAEQEAQLLEDHGHAVLRFGRDNAEIDTQRALKTAADTLWSRETASAVEVAIREFRPDVIHVHNTFPLLSPSFYWAAARQHVPIVQTLHNFRLLCPQAMLLRDGNVCEDCIGRLPWRAVARRCYRDSFAQSAVLTSMLAVHRMLGTYREKITRYIALNDFCRDKFIEGGLPAHKFRVKPNFANVTAPNANTHRSGGLFVGRLSKEKGVQILLHALTLQPNLHIDVIGDGPEGDQVKSHPQVTAHGWLTEATVLAKMAASEYLVLPSQWYENSPRTLIEAFGAGLPVIASRIGALVGLVTHGETGLLFDPKSKEDLARTLHWAASHPEEMRRMGENARREFELRYSAEGNYRQLIEIYLDARRETRTEQAA